MREEDDVQILEARLRVYVGPTELDTTVAFYAKIFGEKCRLRFEYPAVGLELATVGSVLILSGPDEALARYKGTAATFLVDDLDAFTAALPKMGAMIMDGPKEMPTGVNMRVRHPDGTIVEYVQHQNKKAATADQRG